jgi:hypothetical protein
MPHPILFLVLLTFLSLLTYALIYYDIPFPLMFRRLGTSMEDLFIELSLIVLYLLLICLVILLLPILALRDMIRLVSNLTH